MIATLHYVLDPMCSWCWAFRPHWRRVVAWLPEGVAVRYVMGGLAPDSDQPMSPAMQRHLQSVWRLIAERTGAQFNFEFWTRCQPRRSTYPACRAVVAAALQRDSAEAAMIEAIQDAYYMQARNPSDRDTLLELAAEIGLDPEHFARDLDADAVAERLQADFATRDRFGVQGFPSLILAPNGATGYAVAWGYSEAPDVIDRLTRVLREVEAASPEKTGA